MVMKFPSLKRAGYPAGLGLAVLSGVLMTLSIPKADAWPLAWVCLVPVLVALYDAPQRALSLGLTFGLVSGVGKVYWIAETVVSYGGLSLPEGLFSAFMVALLIAVYALVFCLYVAGANWRQPLFPFFAASVWVAMELVQTYLFTGFPWELMGYTQYRVLPVIQIANVTGVYGVSFLVVLVNVAVAMQWTAIRDGTHWRPPVVAAAYTCAALVGTVGYGFVTLARERAMADQTPPLNVSVIQGNIEQGQKWSQAALQHTVDTYLRLTREVLHLQPDFLVYPETALTFYLESPRYRRQSAQVARLVHEAGVPLLTGALGFRPGESDIYNSVYLLAPGQGVIGRYSKTHLVPFGEYLPMPWLFSFLSGLTDDIGAFTPGEALTVMTLPERDVRIGAVICYESIFPDLVRRFVRNGANTLVVVTNDAWFGTSSAPMQHFSMAVLRAVENGVPVIRAANTGISGFIASTGRMAGLTGLFETTTTTARIHPGRDALTLYTRYGDVFAYLCCAAALAGLIRR